MVVRKSKPSLVLCQDEEEASQILHELCRLRTQSRGKVKKLVRYLSTAVLKGDYCFVSTFINIYQRHATTWQVLSWIMRRWVTCPSSRELGPPGWVVGRLCSSLKHSALIGCGGKCVVHPGSVGLCLAFPSGLGRNSGLQWMAFASPRCSVSSPTL